MDWYYTLMLVIIKVMLAAAVLGLMLVGMEIMEH
jgi:hypothetical protein